MPEIKKKTYCSFKVNAFQEKITKILKWGRWDILHEQRISQNKLQMKIAMETT